MFLELNFRLWCICFASLDYISASYYEEYHFNTQNQHSMNHQRYLEEPIDFVEHLLEWLRVNFGMLVHTAVEKHQSCVVQLAL